MADASNNNGMIGGFRIESELKTSGAQGRVYKCVCASDDYPWCARGTTVALKTMPVADADAAASKLNANTRILVSISHPNIVRYLGSFTEQADFSEMLVIVMEFLVGQSLRERLQDHPRGLDADEALKVLTGMVAGLAEAAAHGIVHRDIKPDNVFLCDDGSVKLIDFEVARRSENTTSASGNMVGSFDYMAPDFTDPHFAGDERSDVFSAGVVMHEVLTGKLPYRRFTGGAQQASFAFLERWAQDERGDYIKGGCSVSSSVERIVAHARPVLVKALALRRESRYESFAAVAKGLAEIRFRDLRNGTKSYRILQLVGKGGFGEVFKARSEGRTFAIKHLLKSDYASRFFREAKIMSELDDSCFVRFFDFFVIERAGVREAFLVMDFLPGMPGSSLRDAIQNSAGCGLDFQSVFKAFVRYAHGLKTIHDRAIFHRDIKPTNLYFPENRPESSSIMDLGIARDESGTETTGQVPGTLDYMPPETALGGTRGDAGMDIYALGLCLYEALSGKKGFPRLPSGSPGFAQFFQRARDKARPVFDDVRVTSRPELLKLLERMTDPDPKRRLSSASELERAFRRILEERPASDEAATAAEAMTVTSTSTLTAAEEDARTEDGDEGETCETAFVPASEIPAKATKVIDAGLRELGVGETRRRLRLWILCAATGFALVVSALFVFRMEIDALLTKAMSGGWGRSDAALERTETFAAGVDVPDLYADSSVSVAECDALRNRWLDERKPTLSDQEYARVVGLLDQMRERRKIRDELEADSSRFQVEMKAVVDAYLREGVAAGDRRRDAWLSAWGGSVPSKVDAARRQFAKARTDRLAIDAARALLPRASAAASRIAASYGKNGVKIADGERDRWKTEWSSRLVKDDYATLLQQIEKARLKTLSLLAAEKRRVARKVLLDECRALMEMTTPVRSRESRLSEADVKFRAGLDAGLVERAEYDAFRQELDNARQWTVFEILNRSDLDLTVDGTVVRNGNSQVFVYTNSVPTNLAVTCVGYEPLALDRQSNGRVLTLLPQHFVMLKVEVTVPKLEEGVVCRVDGNVIREATVKLMPGSHECLYSRTDYSGQVIPFRVEPGKRTSLPAPGVWRRSEEWLQRQRDKERAERARAIEARCAALLQDEPVTNRADRLVECSKVLREWTVPDALGAARLKELQARLAQAEKRRVGAVVNGTDLEFDLTVADRPAKLRAGERAVVEYAAEGSLKAALAYRGYEDIPLPDKLDGVEFRVTMPMLRPKPVAVTLPPVAEDVVCKIGGEAVSGTSASLLPGAYEAVFSRPDYDDIHVSFTVRLGEPMSLPSLADWTASEAMRHLIMAERAAEAGDWNRVKDLLPLADVHGRVGLERKMNLSLRHEKFRRFVTRLDSALSAFMDERWNEVVRIYFDLKLNGYVMTAEDRSRVKKSIASWEEYLSMRRRIAEKGGQDVSVESVDAEIRNFRVMSGLLASELKSVRD